MSAPSPQSDYKQEVRFAVVMYGGVSLAIYINGVAQELLRLVRSTAKSNGPLTGTERIYRTVSYLLADEQNGIQNANSDEPDAVPPTRFTVDILSGTSAGGINGIFLAKALANGQDMEQLKDLWVREGDIETLINDKRSVEKPLKLQNPPTSLLNSERLYYELLNAFDGMDKGVAPRKEDDESPLVDELDLFVTSTDLQGVVLPITLSDSLVYEKRHRNVLHFAYSSPSVSGEPTRNDFHGKFNPFLAFAARCTSSFPFAFEPMALSDIDKLLKRMPNYTGIESFQSASKEWQRFYRDYLDPRGVSTVPFSERPFGDGGYLDNKPFSFATETLMNRTASVPVDRKLIYVEPSPEHPEDDVEQADKPDAIENTMLALLTLPRYETIREDLQLVKERNRLIDRVNAVTSGVDRDEEVVRQQTRGSYANEVERWQSQGAFAPPASAELWARKHLTDAEQGQLDLADLIKRKGRSYAAYHRLRISAVTDELAKLITRVAGFDENSEYSIIIRSMVRAWRIKNYIEYRTSADDTRPTASQFLYEFDLSYPIRRVNYLRNKIDAMSRFEKEAMTVINIQSKGSSSNQDDPISNPKIKEAFSQQAVAYKAEANELFVFLRHSARVIRTRPSSKERPERKKLTSGSPLKDHVANLIAEISLAVKTEAVQKDSPSMVIDYFLGKQDPARGNNQRSYRAESLEEESVRRAEKFLDDHQDIMKLFVDTADVLKKRVVAVKTEAERRSSALAYAPNTNPLSPDPEINRGIWLAKNCIGHYYSFYEDYDLVTYPILYDTDVGEADIIDIIRVSPEDATQLINERKTGCHKLAGTALAHFGAFLQKSWRENDILWGRLDGAERIITALLPNHPLREQLIGEAQAEIVCETIGVRGKKEVLELLAESCMRTRTRKAEPELLDRFIKNLRKHTAGNADLTKRLRELINGRSLRQFYVTTFSTRSKVEPEGTLRSIARATNVIGRILEALSSERKVSTKYALWIARLGQIFWALVEVAVPQSFANLIFRHVLKLVYFLEVLLIAGSTLLVQPQTQQFAVTAFGITVAVHLAVIILGDLLKSQNKVLNLAKTIGILFVVVLVIAGALTVSAVLGVESSWRLLSRLKEWVSTPAPLGFNLRTFFRFGLLLVAFMLFVNAIRGDVKDLVKDLVRRLKKAPDQRLQENK